MKNPNKPARLLSPARWLPIMAVMVLPVALLTGAYQNRLLSRASAPFLDSLFAHTDDPHDPKLAAASLKTAEGLETTLFAAEPMLVNPTDIDIDERGRVWVCEAYNYRPAVNGNPVHKEGDRIVILEDTNGDGQADLSKTFYQSPDFEAPLGIWVMGHRAIVSASPNVLLLTDTDGDDRADKKEILFTGINGDQHDHGMHAFVFGPDGKFYFNFGNEGGQLLDKTGRPVIDSKTGQTIDKQHFRQGMVFRCDPDGSHVEVLGHNFRNNYEVAVDSYGTLWQSDNDDDGNKGVRINYVMEGGNYGYTDEMTGAGWQANRTNLEKEIPLRHWHLNDPGAVPNLLQTGAGSPTGMIVYEGTLLPERFRGQMIHCDAGPNVVRSYPVQPDGAGYTAQINNVVEGVRDQWFRPADVCVAPDGSLLVADWYDPGVGGHQAGDQNRGRIFRVAPANTPYRVPTMDLTTVAGAITALQSPNLSVRYWAWNKLHDLGTAAEPALADLYKTSSDRNAGSPRLKARALWLLSKLPRNRAEPYIDAALTDADPNIQITALRAVRDWNGDVTPYIQKLMVSQNRQVLRECAIALRRSQSAAAPGLWAALANRHNGQDRWYLEALGIGAEGQWDTYFAAWLRSANDPTATAAGRDLIWRARTPTSVPLLARLAGNEAVPLQERLRYFRAFDFNPGATQKSQALLAILQANAGSVDITKLALRHLDPTFVKTSAVAQTALTKLLTDVYGTAEYLELVARYEPASENGRLHQLALAKYMDGLGRDASRLLLNQNGAALVWKTINGKDQTTAANMLTALRYVGTKASLDILKTVALDAKRPVALRMEATRAIGRSWDGESLILALLKSGEVTGDYKKAAVEGVSGAWRKAVRTEAAGYLTGTTSATGQKIPAIADLLALTGNPANGLSVFKTNCGICHQVNGEGQNFGPKLSEIGAKLGKEGQYLAILYPDAGISFGYEGYEVTFKDGSTMSGIVASKTETDLQLNFPGGTTGQYKMATVKSMKKMESSMMPAGLHENMTRQELADLVEYLGQQKKK
jgi:putative membrane-bound dehydrogenase-like protein